MIIPFPSVDPEQQSLGRRLRAIREARGLSVEELASETHLAALDISRAEIGRKRLSSSQMHAVISVLHVPLGLIFASDVDLTQIRRF